MANSMKELFKVVKNYQDSDSEGYCQFKSQDTISYHNSHAGATNKIEAKIKEELEDLKEIKKMNPHLKDKKYWNKREELIKDNKTMIVQGTHRDYTTTYDLFEVITIQVED